METKGRLFVIYLLFQQAFFYLVQCDQNLYQNLQVSDHTFQQSHIGMRHQNQN